MFKVYAIVRFEDSEAFKHELDGVLYPDRESAVKAQESAIKDDLIEDKFDIIGWDIEEVIDG